MGRLIQPEIGTPSTKPNDALPLVGVALCIGRDKKVLLHQRKGPHAPGRWAFPGGHLEMWEEFATCALRELREEAGPVRVTPPRYWTVMNTFFPDEHRHSVVIFMRADWISGEAEVMEPDKCAQWGWFDWDNLPHPLMRGIEMLYERGVNPLL